MRLFIKKQCLETMKLLEEAHIEIERDIANGQIEAAMGLLEECQAGAIGIGNLIEESEGENTDEVHRLEEYCERLYHLHEDIAHGDAINIKKQIKNLHKPLLKAVNGLRNHIPSTKEVVFLPYKASMWDSLEAEWKRIDKDSECNAVVVPIPYFEKKPDGSMKSIKYEIDQYPDYVPVVHYMDYNLEENHPEVIYIHNPYDEMNFVTSVLPQFYSSKIKDYTDELIYIPYFVWPEIDPRNETVLNNIAHFVTTPGVLNADRVIVQSESVRQAYINILVKYAGENTRLIWEKKIEGGGSPKLERVDNLIDSDFKMPDDWKRIAYKADGSRKKMIFYNTGIAALLQTNEDMIKKIQRNLQLFQEYRDDIALLWRPHPLIEATLTSMRPELWDAYKRIVDDYKASGWGIYDDSADLDRAIALSDAYYGDHSSVVVLYQKTGKPVMIQNVNV